LAAPDAGRGLAYDFSVVLPSFPWVGDRLWSALAGAMKDTDLYSRILGLSDWSCPR